MKTFFFLSISFMLCIASSCVEKHADKPSKNQNSNENDDKTSNLINANFNFALKLYHSMKTADNNLFFSPYSISNALSMLYIGAKNKTAKQIKKTLFYDYPDNDIPQTFKKLNDELINSASDKRINFLMANAVWGCVGASFNGDFINTIKENYNVTPEYLDFANNPDSSMIKINKWVSDNTQGKIENIMYPGLIKPETNLVLVGTIYFEAKWKNHFIS